VVVLVQKGWRYCISYKCNPQNYKSSPLNCTPKANLFGFANVIPADAGIQTFPCRQKNKKSKSCLSCKSRPKSFFGKTNPIQKSITHYKERTNPKNRKIKTNPNEPINPFVENFRCPPRNKKNAGGE
jgi:hypothetical protein